MKAIKVVCRILSLLEYKAQRMNLFGVTFLLFHVKLSADRDPHLSWIAYPNLTINQSGDVILWHQCESNCHFVLKLKRTSKSLNVCWARRQTMLLQIISKRRADTSIDFVGQ